MSDPRRDAGFLYLEVLVALALVALTLATVAPLFLVGARQVAAAGDTTFAATLAQERIESFRAVPFADLVAGSGRDTRRQHGVRYERAWSVTVDVPHPGMKTVEVKVTTHRARGAGVPRVARARLCRAF